MTLCCGLAPIEARTRTCALAKPKVNTASRAMMIIFTIFILFVFLRV
jgi:hypothetical protein